MTNVDEQIEPVIKIVKCPVCGKGMLGYGVEENEEHGPPCRRCERVKAERDAKQGS